MAIIGWCRHRDAGQCPRCGMFIERRDGCNHMDCRCGHSFCWLCLQPLENRCGCPQFGGRRTADARERLSSPGWRRAVLLSAEAASLRVLFLAILYGLSLHRADALAALATTFYHSAINAPTLTKIIVTQFLLGALQLATARSCLRVLPRRIYIHVAIRQLDLCCGGAGTDVSRQPAQASARRSHRERAPHRQHTHSPLALRGCMRSCC